MWMLGASLIGHSISGQHVTTPAQSHSGIRATVISSEPSSEIQITLSGTIQNGALVLPVVLTQNVGGHTVTIKGSAMLDTGDQMAVTVDGTALEEAGEIPSNSVTIYGFGGSSQVRQYLDISIAPAQLSDAPFVSNITAYGGEEVIDQAVGGSAAQGTPYVACIGLPVLSQGTLVVHGNRWSWTYTPLM
ncbi:hypothetical protein Aaci_0607 [Alicyclobacillus acidocaldarius subsp. acidocaldarius DSM 446]|uniref:Uncharacterized protein n=1 Tax=Alicyclobacillus acidocaldarius subsp. acidocaldarius (strain ATCC 27009 / DSM 446 / BCRC 14685 / JCM 5260 / KCTC 1825 / NBRC 15652 / NCIMB 11725 / NRRL B-14509 / 104-IA) TaxID=521098 RepID=C8WSZ9_ALIAD|nr:hypothetical protein Aaci_0607 [Alicyclobacillus acidocaldarius subsp. acidocaldarius DSM 446]